MSKFIEDVDSIKGFIFPQCNTCVHNNAGTGRCAVFPDRIPKEILLNKFDHHNPYPGDNGIRYEAK